MPRIAPRSYYLILRVDTVDQVFEHGRDANDRVVPTPITVRVADLRPTAFTASVPLIAAGGTLTVACTVLNEGTAPAAGTWLDQVRLSTDATFDLGDTYLANVDRNGPITAGASYDVANQGVTIPAGTPPGTYWLVLHVDVGGIPVFEAGEEGDNTAAIPLVVN